MLGWTLVIGRPAVRKGAVLQHPIALIKRFQPIQTASGAPMRFSHACLVVGSILTPVLGCGGNSGPNTIDSSALETYIDENPQAVARQAEIVAEREQQQGN